MSMVNTVLNTICAEKFKVVDWINTGEKPENMAQEALDKHFKVIFNETW